MLGQYLPSKYLNQVDIANTLPPGMLPGYGGITIGAQIFLDNRDRPNTSKGIALIGHEVLHTMQQDISGAVFFASYLAQAASNYLTTLNADGVHDSISFEKRGIALEQKILADLKQSGNNPCGCGK